MIDLIGEMRAIYWNEADQGATFTAGPIPDALVDACAVGRELLLEVAAEANDELMERYLEEGSL